MALASAISKARGAPKSAALPATIKPAISRPDTSETAVRRHFVMAYETGRIERKVGFIAVGSRMRAAAAQRTPARAADRQGAAGARASSIPR